MFSDFCEAHNRLIKRRDRTLPDFLYWRGVRVISFPQGHGFLLGEEVGGRGGGVSGGGGGCESDLTSTPIEMCRWGGGRLD
jgi:hypothetical protein